MGGLIWQKYERRQNREGLTHVIILSFGTQFPVQAPHVFCKSSGTLVTKVQRFDRNT